MRLVTLAELAAYINSQPKNRVVKMFQPHGNDECGCVMVHWAKDNGIKNLSACTSGEWYVQSAGVVAKIEDGKFIWYLFDKDKTKHFNSVAVFRGTYGELKKLLKPEYQ